MSESETEQKFRAQFVAQNDSTRRQHTNLLASTDPLVVSALFRVFPLITILNGILDHLTWTSADPYVGIAHLFFLYFFVLNYDTSIYQWYLPAFLVLAYSAVNYYVNSVYNVIHNTEQGPTLDEIVDALDNLTIKLEILLRPFKTLTISYRKLINFIIIFTPLHIIVMKFLISPKTFFFLLLFFATTFHSTWFQATLRILWRSQFFRNVFSFFAGVNSTSYLYNNYKILNESKLPESKSGKTIQFRIYEHQRRWIYLGWSDKLLPYERSNFTNESLQETSPPEQFKFPFNSHNWQWLEEKWSLDLSSTNSKNPDGWSYYDNYWENKSCKETVTSYTRTRIWTRKAVIITQK